MTYIRNQDYTAERVRPKLLTHYLEQMVAYLRLRHPLADTDMITGFVKEKIREFYKIPEVEAIIHKSEGNSEVVKIKLDKYITETIKDNNLSPSGSSYLPVSKRESYLRMSIDGKIKARNAFKKLYLDYEAQGKKRESQYYNQNQANAKIFNNAIAGGMGITQFILGSKAGFNAITSSGRMSVKQAYSFIERAVNSNIYLPTIKDAITYVLNHIRHIPDSFYLLVQNNTLYLPSTEDVVHYLISSVKNYTTKLHTDDLVRVITGLSDTERSYVFYAGCINNLCRFNVDMTKTWIDSCFLPDYIDPILYQDVDPKELKDYSGDVISCILSTNYKRLGLKPGSDTIWNSPKEAAINNPEGLKAFIYACRHFVQHLEPFLPILKPILQVQTTFAKLTFQHRLARYTVHLSDTDSNIFSTQELIKWKRGKIDFSQESYEMNAIITFLLSQSLEHVFARLSAGFGVEGKDVFGISMKNEFLYPIMIVTALGKHYLAIATMQEGSRLPNPRKDFKGIGLRSSAYPKPVRETFDAFIVDLFTTIEKAEPIRAAFILHHVAGVEKTIADSVMNRESTYLQTVSVRRKEDYADAMASQYFYYIMWNEVFAEEFGEMIIPNKCYKVPLKGGKKLLKDPVFMDKLKLDHPNLFKRLTTFMEKYPKRDISTILIPPSKGRIHPLFVEMMDIRSHISQIMMGYYHVLNALGIGTVSTDVNALVSDSYDPSTPLLD